MPVRGDVERRRASHAAVRQRLVAASVISSPPHLAVPARRAQVIAGDISAIATVMSAQAAPVSNEQDDADLRTTW